MAGDLIAPKAGYPENSVGMIFADGVTSLQPGDETVRFYLARACTMKLKTHKFCVFL